MSRILPFFVILLWPCMASAQNCLGPDGAEGDIFYNTVHNVPQYCNGTEWISFGSLNPAAGGSGCFVPDGIEGDLIYNSSYHVLQYCDGDDWRAVGSGMSVSFAGPASCPDVGDLCSDGTIFIGWHPVLNEQLFIPPADEASTPRWKSSGGGANDIAVDSLYDGRANTNQLPNSATFPAFKLCKDLTLGGYTDWYLPSTMEIYYLWSLHQMIEAKGHTANFLNAYYWSSSEYNNTYIWTPDFTNGINDHSTKGNNYQVRCMRR